VPMSTDSFRSFLEIHPFDRLNQRIASVNQAELFHTSMMPFLPILEDFGFQTLGDIQLFVEENADDAYHLALSQLAVTDLDIMSDSVGLQNLCIVYVLKQGRGVEGVSFIYNTINGQRDSNITLAKAIVDIAANMSFMNKK